MENASKALIMAGGILISLLIISLVVFMFSNLGNAQTEAEIAKEAMQIEKYNKRFEQYNRSMLYGSDIISVINLAEDYNTVQASEKLDYTPITLKVIIKLDISLVEGKSQYIIRKTIHEIGKEKGDNYNLKNVLRNINGEIENIENKYKKEKEPIDNIIRIKQKYDNEINSYKMLGREEERKATEEKYKKEMEKYGGKDQVEKDIKTYIALKSTNTSFRNKYFTAKDVKYDDTGRMVSITFEEVEPNL